MSAAALALVTCLVAQPTGEDLAGIEFFEKRIRPLLVESCYRCHSRTAKRLRGGLLVDSRAGLLEGGDSGPAIVPGKPEESRLIRAVSYEDEDLQMPPKGKLPKGAIADLVAWVRRGGPYPRVDPSRGRVEKSPPADLEKARRFWAFRPVVEPPLPPVEDADWCRSPLDRFVLSGLDEAGLRPAPPATRRAFVRRATFDLTGLPPAPEEVGVFLTDESPDAYERLVDRLLASPRHGERWGRHWLDVARYADSNGVDENMAYANAYRYRDYVIDSFNRDKPFDRLIHEQIAGDLLPGRPGEDPNERIERLIATGFLSLGPKMIACDDGRKMELDIVDEQLDTVCRAFLGITMGCARCHDHKFDPFSTADYYGLAGIFKSTKTMENFKVVAVWHEHEIATPEERQAFETHEEKIRDVDRRRQESERVAREEFLARERKKAGRYFGAAAGLVGLGPLVADGSYALGGLASPKDLRERAILREAEAFDRGDLTVDTTNWGPGIGVLLHEGHAEYDLELPRGGRYQLELRYAAQESRPVRIIVNGDVVKDDGAREVTGGWHAKHQRWHVEGAFDFRRGRNVVRLERRSGPVPHIDKLLLVPVEPGAGRAGSSAGGANSAATPVSLRREILERWVAYLREGKRGAEAVTKALREADGENRALLVREYAGRFREAEVAWQRLRDRRAGKTGSLSDPELERLRAILHDEKGPYRLSGDLGRFLGEAARRELERLGEEKKELEKSRPVLPRAMGVRDGKVEDLRVHIRGNYQTLGDEVPRRFPRIFGEDPKPLARESSGRLELARWMTRREHPLTARVMANRIWLWHFGEGIVRTPDNFGTLGEPPSHPQLLDWLALRFVESGWSLKAMHRLVLLSSTYRMSTTFNGKAAGVDPKNLLWWRFPRRRLEAEEIRDSVLALGRALDLRMYGQLLPDKNRDYVTGTGSKEATYDFPRRSVYLPVLRSAVYQVFQTFDFADPSVLSGRRATTTVAPQALFLMNGSLVLRETRRAAERLLARPDTDDRERVRLAYELALSRPATAAELEGALEFVSRYEATVDVGEAAEGERRIRAWQGLCRVLVASNEFVYLD